MDGLYDYEEDEEYPWLSTATGVNPIGQDYLWLPFRTRYNDAPPPSKPLVEVSSEATALEGGGSKEILQALPASAATNASQDIAEDSLNKAQKEELRKKITRAEEQALDKPLLKVETLKVGKTKADKKSEESLDSEGFGKKEKSAKKVKHCLKFA